jgi:hypothetical protein
MKLSGDLAMAQMPLSGEYHQSNEVLSVVRLRNKRDTNLARDRCPG